MFRRLSVTVTCAGMLVGCATARPVSSTMFARDAVTKAIRSLEAYDGGLRVQSLDVTCTTAEVLFRRRGLEHDVVRRLSGYITDDVSRDGAPGPQGIPYSMRGLNAAGPERLIAALRRRLDDDAFLPASIGLGPAGMGLRGVSHGRAAWFRSDANGGHVRAVPAPTVPLAYTCAAG